MKTTWSSQLAEAAVCLLAIVGCASPHLETRESFGQGPPAHRSNAQFADLRTTLGRAGISLDLGGSTSEILFTSSCREALVDRAQPGCVRCDLVSETYPIDHTTLDAAKRAFDLYPTDFLVASGITGVALCRRLMYVDIRPDRQLDLQLTGTVARDAELGTVDLHARRLLINLEPFVDEPSNPAAAYPIDGVIHHELFHQLEFDRIHDKWTDDPEWRLHNPLGFEYQNREPDARPLGFVTSYAAKSAEEDRATVFEWIMTRPDALCVMAAADPVVRDKVELVWERVAAIAGDRFLRRRAPCVDWIDRPETQTPTPQGEPVHRYPSFRNASLVDQPYLRPPSR